MQKLLAVITAGFILCAFAGCGVDINPGDGEKIGNIVRLKRQGLFTKTWEAEIIRGGINSGTGSTSGTAFYFTVESDELVAEVKKAMEDQTEVIITFRQEGFYSGFRTDSMGAFLVSIRPARK